MIGNKLNSLQKKLTSEKATRDYILRKVEKNKKKVITSKTYHEDAIVARAFLQRIAEETQKKLGFHITKIVSTALAAVFDDPYEFNIKFVSRRNKTECDLSFTKDGEVFDPLEDSGGGPLDIASLALRIAVWSLNKTRSFMALDEPTKFVSVNLHHKVSKLLKMLSSKLLIQFLIVSHQKDMILSADKVFNFKKGSITND